MRAPSIYTSDLDKLFHLRHGSSRVMVTLCGQDSIHDEAPPGSKVTCDECREIVAYCRQKAVTKYLK